MEQKPTTMPKHLLKRDGSVKDFDSEKIVNAVMKAGKATQEFDEATARAIVAERVLPKLCEAKPTVTLHIEEVQDAVEHALFDAGYFTTLRAYIVYRESRAKARDAKKSWVNVESSINEYLEQVDWRVNANANQGYSLGGLILNVSGKVVANYWLNYIYPPEVGRAHREADFHVHDLDMLSGYCAGWSLRTLLQEGLNGVAGKVEANPPKHLSSATGQIVNFLGTMQNEWAGAQAFSSFDTYLAPFIRKDNLPYDEVLQCMQELIYNLNVPSRWGTQTPFTNLTFDWVCPEDLKPQRPIIGGEEMPFTYGELVGAIRAACGGGTSPQVPDAGTKASAPEPDGGELRFDALTAYAGDDAEAAQSILASFAEQTAANCTALCEALDADDAAGVKALAHKMLPIFTMLGAGTVADTLRRAETHEGALTDTLRRELAAVAERIRGIAAEAGKRAFPGKAASGGPESE